MNKQLTKGKWIRIEQAATEYALSPNWIMSAIQSGRIQCRQTISKGQSILTLSRRDLEIQITTQGGMAHLLELKFHELLLSLRTNIASGEKCLAKLKTLHEEFSSWDKQIHSGHQDYQQAIHRDDIPSAHGSHLA